MRKPDPLNPYQAKRNFTVTPEPSGCGSGAEQGWAFVVQKHDARSTHYDLRLELDGVLKSWAVPKGPSLQTGEKRLAVHVEDHPLDYVNFEGTIPAHQYGAGTVFIWDRGTWEPVGDPRQGLESGHLKFTLHGEKLKGAWVLVQMRRKTGAEKDWLLIKERDTAPPVESEQPLAQPSPNPAAGDAMLLSLPSGAQPGPVPDRLAPQLATLTDQPPPGGDWTYEIKFDGYRMLTRFDSDAVTIFTRNGHDWTAKLASLVEPLKQLPVAPGWLDGEIVLLGDDGRPDFGALQSAFDAARTGEIVYFIFDMPFYAGYDLRQASLAARRVLLADVLQPSTSSRIRFSEDFTGSGPDILHSACSMGLEGVIGKRKGSAYVSGRSPNWIKLKCNQRQEFVIVGFTSPTSPIRGFKSLLLAMYDQDAQLRYAGKVGTGFNARNSPAITANLNRLAADKPPLFEVPKGITANWVRPELVAEVSFTEWTKDGLVRHGVFHGLRSDKSPDKITREKPAVDIPAATTQNEPGSDQPVPVATVKNGSKPRRSVQTATRNQTISNPDRVVDPTTSLTKMDLANYYRLAAGRMLPHLQDRPVSFLRAPEGISGDFFFQKHGEKLKIPGLKLLDPALTPGHPAMMSIDTEEALIGAVQMNVIEFHTWNGTVKNIEKPDRMVFDLDPGEGVGWAMIIEAAELTRTLLEELELQSFLKTSGGKGLHVVVPLKPRDDWDTVKAFSKGVASHLARIIPDYFTAISGPRNRVGKIFIDYNRNGRGATTAAAFSARARAGLGVSMPCSWSELKTLTSGSQWTINNGHIRLESDHDPWQDYGRNKQILKASSKRLMVER